MNRQSFRRGSLFRLGGMLHASLDHMGFRQKVLEQQAIMRWKETVGPQIAASSVAEKVRDGALFVCCKSSMWANELSLHKQDIIKRLNKSLGKQIIIDIRFSARGFKQALEARTQKEPLPTVSETLDTVQVAQEDVDTASRLASISPSQELAEKIRRAIITSKRLSELKRQDKTQD